MKYRSSMLEDVADNLTKENEFLEKYLEYLKDLQLNYNNKEG